VTIFTLGFRLFFILLEINLLTEKVFSEKVELLKSGKVENFIESIKVHHDLVLDHQIVM
jgi:hypothetical protein